MNALYHAWVQVQVALLDREQSWWWERALEKPRAQLWWPVLPSRGQTSSSQKSREGARQAEFLNYQCRGLESSLFWVESGAELCPVGCLAGLGLHPYYFCLHRILCPTGEIPYQFPKTQSNFDTNCLKIAPDEGSIPWDSSCFRL